MRNKGLSTCAVARMLNVATGSVADWIDQKQLKAGRSHGGHRRVRVDDLLHFLQQQNLPVPRELQQTAPTILVVDDEPAIARWIANELRAEHPDYQVLEAHDGYMAAELAVAHKPNVVILDLQMPGLDGYEVCRRIKTRSDTRLTTVIAMTGYSSPEAAQDVLACGAQACVAKPLTFPALLKEVELATKQR